MPGGDDFFAERHRKRLEREKREKERLPTEEEPDLPPPVKPVQADKTPGRNDPCPCGSGKKYKKCCGKQDPNAKKKKKK